MRDRRGPATIAFGKELEQVAADFVVLLTGWAGEPSLEECRITARAQRASQGEARAVPAGDYDYEAGGVGYARHRRADPRFAAVVHEALGDPSTVVNARVAGAFYPGEREPLCPSIRSAPRSS